MYLPYYNRYVCIINGVWFCKLCIGVFNFFARVNKNLAECVLSLRQLMLPFFFVGSIILPESLAFSI